MKYVILIHSTPQPWGHPTWDHIAGNRELPHELREQLRTEFDAMMAEIQERGELVGAEALGDPASSTLFRWDGTRTVPTDGPYTEAKEQFAGYFLIDVESPERAREIASRFGGPGETIELRPSMWPGGEDA